MTGWHGSRISTLTTRTTPTQPDKRSCLVSCNVYCERCSIFLLRLHITWKKLSDDILHQTSYQYRSQSLVEIYSTDQLLDGRVKLAL
jgi:hypothetical protein